MAWTLLWDSGSSSSKYAPAPLGLPWIYCLLTHHARCGLRGLQKADTPRPDLDSSRPSALILWLGWYSVVGPWICNRWIPLGLACGDLPPISYLENTLLTMSSARAYQLRHTREQRPYSQFVGLPHRNQEDQGQ